MLNIPRTRTHTITHARAHAHKHTHAHTRAHTRAHTPHTHTRAHSARLCGRCTRSGLCWGRSCTTSDRACPGTGRAPSLHRGTGWSSPGKCRCLWKSTPSGTARSLGSQGCSRNHRGIAGRKRRHSWRTNPRRIRPSTSNPCFLRNRTGRQGRHRSMLSLGFLPTQTDRQGRLQCMLV